MALRSKPCSFLLCDIISSTQPNCLSEKRSLKLVVSGSLASSWMLPTELAVSESVSDILDAAINVSRFLGASFDLANFVSRGCRVKLPVVGEGSAVSVIVL